MMHIRKSSPVKKMERGYVEYAGDESIRSKSIFMHSPVDLPWFVSECIFSEMSSKGEE